MECPIGLMAISQPQTPTSQPLCVNTPNPEMVWFALIPVVAMMLVALTAGTSAKVKRRKSNLAFKGLLAKMKSQRITSMSDTAVSSKNSAILTAFRAWSSSSLEGAVFSSFLQVEMGQQWVVDSVGAYFRLMPEEVWSLGNLIDYLADGSGWNRADSK